MVSRSQRLCRLCEFPATDGGVPLDALDAGKWDEWCRRELGEELHISSDAEQVLVICQFCIWEARLFHESSLDDCSEKDKGCDWWTGHDHDHFFREYFFKKPVIGPCKVVLEKISSDFEHLLLEDIDCPRSNAHLEAKTQACHSSTLVERESDIKATNSNSSKIYQCSICPIFFHKKYCLAKHIKSIHKNIVRCKRFHCVTYFLTDNERLQHEQKFHLNGATNKTVKCIYCGDLLKSKTLYNHMKRLHKDAIKCDYNKTCANYFHTENGKNDHIFNEHTQGLQLKMTPMKCIYCDKISKNKYFLREHINKFHNDVRIKCRVKGCVVYFLSKKESEQHFLQVHQHAESLKKWQCPKCSFKTDLKLSLQCHLKRIHVNKDSSTRFKCPQCPKYFHAKILLTDHTYSFHVGRSTCQFCGKTMLKSSMTRHFLGGACKSIPI